MPNIGISELLIILAIVIIIFGASKIPEIGRALGQGISNFKKAIKDASKEEKDKNESSPSKLQ
jgi:sec-independent protein translocase protein TatA